MRILIAEDDFTSRNVLSGILRKHGHEVMAAVDGAEAWELLQKPEAPSLVILDWMMPGMNGPEVVQRVPAVQNERPPYIIMLTARGDKSDIITGLQAGANDYLAKPFDPGELYARVEVGRRMIQLQEALIESREILSRQATHDALTGLLSRGAILEYLAKELARTARHGNLLMVGMCDIDFFKQVNDTYGHLTGDEVLCALARILEANCRKYDAVGRLGGEEFLMVAPVSAGTDGALLFQRVRRQVAESQIATRSGPLSVTLSIGVACANAQTTVDAILESADQSLYQAKREGRNHVVFEGQRLT